MNRCSIFGHKRVRLGKPFKNTGPDKNIFVLDHCSRCRMVIGVWVWYSKFWRYFKE